MATQIKDFGMFHFYVFFFIFIRQHKVSFTNVIYILSVTAKKLYFENISSVLVRTMGNCEPIKLSRPGMTRIPKGIVES